jgi:predicted AlkP superfamily phosphohydrolase/phosphomutase
LREPVIRPTPIGKAQVDWGRTKAWGEGGYYSRIFMNVKGREPQGIIEPSAYEKVRDELKAKLEAMPDDQGRPLGTRVFRPEEVYKSVQGIAPDLIVYFGDLNWRSVGTIGLNTVYTFENDTGPDDANHAEYGMFLLSERNGNSGGELHGKQLFDVFATILDRFGLPMPRDAHGKPLDRP